ncbi:MAG: hypothetical protein P8100_01280 [bacterium]
MKHLCALNKKGFDKNLSKILDAIQDPTHICKKCSRVANTKDRLCKPTDMKSLQKKKAD